MELVHKTSTDALKILHELQCHAKFVPKYQHMKRCSCAPVYDWYWLVTNRMVIAVLLSSESKRSLTGISLLIFRLWWLPRKDNIPLILWTQKFPTNSAVVTQKFTTGTSRAPSTVVVSMSMRTDTQSTHSCFVFPLFVLTFLLPRNYLILINSKHRKSKKL